MEKIIDDENGLIFHIDKNNHKASVAISSNTPRRIFIPRIINHNLQEYPIREIINCSENSNSISIDFPDDSEIQIFKDGTFDFSHVTSLFIPASVKELRNGWCCNANCLFQVTVSPNNTNFANFGKDIIIGKSDPQIDFFDTIFFGSRNLNQVTIPSFIRKIDSYAFSDCDCLGFVEFQDNSSLEIICNNSFYHSRISSIIIPKSTKIIGKEAFKDCSNLMQIKIPENSELHTIYDDAFANTLIDYLYIPANLKELKEKCFNLASSLSSVTISPKNKYYSIIDEKMIVGKSKSENDFDVLISAIQNVYDVLIPSNIKIINCNAFYQCKKLMIVNFGENSQLEVIKKSAFSFSAIKCINIPKSVTTIGNKAFYKSCLQEINIDDDSKLKFIGEYAFSRTLIKSIKIPKHVKTIGYAAFYDCLKLEEIIFEKDCEINDIGSRAFQHTSIKYIKIPKEVRDIKKNTFLRCDQLEEIEIEEPSKMKIIYYNSISSTKIKRFTIPSSIETIEEGWCQNTKKLIEVNISKDNKHFISLDNKIIISCLLSESPKLDRNEDSDEYDDFQYDFYDDYILTRQTKNAQKNNNQIKKGPNEEGLFNVLLFVPRDIKEVIVPKYIKYIDSYAFSGCSQLERVEFEPESSLELISTESFSKSSIKSIIIPKSVKKIKEKAFNSCNSLKSLQFMEDSQLERIEENFVSLALMKQIKIPNNAKMIKKNAFNYYTDSKTLEFLDDSEIATFEEFSFNHESIERIYLPPKLKEISDSIFDLYTLSEISISPQNKYFSLINDGKIIVGKSDINNSNFDIVVFALPCIEHATIPSNITKVNSKAFANCKSLNTLKFAPNSHLETICQNAFFGLAITKIVIPDSVKVIENGAFENYFKTNVEIEISMNSELQLIGANAFRRSKIKKIFIPKFVKTIREYAFYDSSLEEIEFAEDSQLQKIGMNAFSLTNINSIIIPKHLKEIMDYTFSECKNLKSVLFTEDSELEAIYSRAFIFSSISSINFPSKLKKLDDDWSSNIKKLIDIFISPSNQYFKYINEKIIIQKSNANSNQYDVLLFALRDIKEVRIPSYIKIIKSGAFSYCKNIETIEFSENSQLEVIEPNSFNKSIIKKGIIIPKNTKIIHNFAFQCSKIKCIKFQEDSELYQIGEEAFYKTEIEKFDFPNKMKYVSLDIFKYCEKLREVIFSNSVELINPSKKVYLNIEKITIPPKVDNFDVIYALNKLTEIRISPNNKYFSDLNGKIITKKSNPYNDSYDIIYYVLPSIKHVFIPSYIKKIVPGIFSNMQNITAIEFEKDSQLRIIERNTFSNLNITEICIPKNVKIIGDSAFANCQSLQKVEFSKDSELEIIEQNSFQSTPKLIKINIPKKVTIINDYAFYESCLQEINIDDDSKLKFIGEFAFSRTLIKSIKIPKHVKTIGYAAFYDCLKLEEIIFEKDCEINDIGIQAFQHTSIKYIKIPKEVRDIKENTFFECDQLEEIEIEEPSKMKIIYYNSISSTKIKRFTIPSSIETIEEGWCQNTKKLIEVNISKDNKHFISLDNKIIISCLLSESPKLDRNDHIAIGHSDFEYEYDYDNDIIQYQKSHEILQYQKKHKETSIFNVLLFVPRDIKEVIVPKYIKYIDSYAFSGCSQLERVKFEPESSLELISTESFSNSSIKSIIIPKSVKIIEKSSFSPCDNLKEFHIDNEAQVSINDFAIGSICLRGFSIPALAKSISSCAFYHCENLNSIEFLGNDIVFDQNCSFLENISFLSFPNADNISIIVYHCYLNEKIIIFTKYSANIKIEIK